MNKSNNPPFKQWYRFRHNSRFRNHGILRDNTMLKFSNWWDTKVRQPYNRRFNRVDSWNPYIRAARNPNANVEFSYNDPYQFENQSQNTQQNMAFNQNNQYEDPLPPPDQYPNQQGDPNQIPNYGGPINIYNNPIAYGGSGSGTGTTSGTTLTAGQQGGMGMIGGVVGIIQGIRQSRLAKKQADRARRQMKKERQKLREYENIYKNLDTSNPYMNMENTMEDLTINQKEAEFRRQQFEQSQSNIMEGLRDAAGGSGIGALAQSLAQQGQLQAQKSAATVGEQEARNNLLAAQEAGRIQQLERQGDMMSRQMQFGLLESQMGMTLQEIAMERGLEYGLGQQSYDAASGLTSGFGDMFGAMEEGGVFE